MPEEEQFGLERQRATFFAGEKRGVQRLHLMVAQIRGDAHALDTRFLPLHQVRQRIDIEVQGHSRAVAPFGERVAFDHLRWQHGDLLSRNIGGGQSRPRDLVQPGAGGESQGRRRDMYADAITPVGKSRQGKGVVDFGRARVVQAECGGSRQRQLGRLLRPDAVEDLSVARKILEQKFAQMVVMTGR